MPLNLPAGVAEFISARIDTVPELEALVLLHENAPGAWTVEALAARLYLAEEDARQVLAALERKGLAARAPGAPDRFALRASPEEVATVQEVVDTYRRRVTAVAQLIHSKASVGVREFARAFRIKKDG